MTQSLTFHQWISFGLKAKSQDYSLKFDEDFVPGCCDMILSTFLEMDKVVLKRFDLEQTSHIKYR